MSDDGRFNFHARSTFDRPNGVTRSPVLGTSTRATLQTTGVIRAATFSAHGNHSLGYLIRGLVGSNSHPSVQPKDIATS